jgi:uncharacterized SAM-dependent methyltransferase
MRLVSRIDQQVTVNGQPIDVAADEAILTEYSHKYELDEFADLAADAGFGVDEIWVDDDRLFSLQLLVRDSQ